MILRVLSILLLLFHWLFGYATDKERHYDNLLPNSHIYIDKTNSLSFQEVQNKTFYITKDKYLGFGYSPQMSVWIKVELENNTSTSVDKIIEYANPLTTDVIFFDPQNNLRIQEGLIHQQPNRSSLTPAFKISLPPYSSKTLYIKASSHITTLIVKLHLWHPQRFYQKEIRHQVILALFFGAMGIIILYNLLIYLSTREMSYLYYVLFFISIVIHQLFYRAVAGLYIFSQETVALSVEYSSFIVALPALFFALFTQKSLELKQYPKINKVLNYYLMLFPLLVTLAYLMELHRYKNIFSILLSIFLFLIIVYATYRRNRQAYFLIVGWFFSIISGLLLYLSSLGLFISDFFEYYAEFALIVESLIFSLLLADKIKQLHQEKLTLQANLINHQKTEQKKLATMVELQTGELQKSLEEKELLLKEFNHRLKNTIQTMVSFLRIQIDEIKEPKTQNILRTLENRMISISHLYSLLYTHNSMSVVDSCSYFSLLVEDIQNSFDMPHIDIAIDSNLTLPSEYAIYCGFILNEAITNSLQHAFKDRAKGAIEINLHEDRDTYFLIIRDNGSGYEQQEHRESLGLMIIETLVVTQLQGKLEIDSTNGVTLKIQWSKNDE